MNRKAQLAELTRIVARLRPGLKAAAKAHDGETSGRLWREVEAVAERLFPGEGVTEWLGIALTPFQLESEP